MSSSSAAAAGGALLASPRSAAYDHRVYMAVVGWQSEDDVERLIEEIAQGDDEKCKRVVEPKYESPLAAAHRLFRYELVCRLLAAGADVKQLYNGEATALAVCCMHGEVDCVRALLARGHDANERMTNFWRPQTTSAKMEGLTAVHVCARFSGRFGHDGHLDFGSDGQLDCLRVLVKEGGADINAVDEDGNSALARLDCWDHSPSLAQEMLAPFVELGINLDFRTTKGRTQIFSRVTMGDLPLVQALLEAGASPDVADNDGWTPLIYAAKNNKTFARRKIIETLVQCSRPQTLRAVNRYGSSAADWLVPQGVPVTATLLEPWELRAIAQLKHFGAPLSARNVLRAMPSAAAHAQWLEREMRARRSDSRRWRAHDCFVPLAFDARDAYEAEERVARLEARVRELEEALGEEGGEGATQQQEEEESVAARLKKRRRSGG